jgi:hypothetical protein
MHVAGRQRPASGANPIQRRKSEVNSERLLVLVFFQNVVVPFEGQCVSMLPLHKYHL